MIKENILVIHMSRISLNAINPSFSKTVLKHLPKVSLNLLLGSEQISSFNKINKAAKCRAIEDGMN